jgi:hypothetical protein
MSNSSYYQMEKKELDPGASNEAVVFLIKHQTL